MFVYILYLVGGLEHVFFHSVGNVIIPTDFPTIIFQRGGEKPPARLWYIPVNPMKDPINSH